MANPVMSITVAGVAPDGALNNFFELSHRFRGGLISFASARLDSSLYCRRRDDSGRPKNEPH